MTISIDALQPYFDALLKDCSPSNLYSDMPCCARFTGKSTQMAMAGLRLVGACLVGRRTNRISLHLAATSRSLAAARRCDGGSAGWPTVATGLNVNCLDVTGLSIAAGGVRFSGHLGAAAEIARKTQKDSTSFSPPKLLPWSSGLT